MRVPIVLLALASAPFLAGAAQDRAASIQDDGKCAVADAQRSPTSWSLERPPDPKGRDRTGCSPVPPAPQTPPPPPPTSPPPPAGTASIMGSVFNDITGLPGLSGWVIELTGTVTATVVSDATGSYRFSGLPHGTYTICEAVQSGWRQTWPTPPATSCPTGLGYTFEIVDGERDEFVDFGNVRQ